MCTPNAEYICVPIFTGLFTWPIADAARLFSMRPCHIKLTPLSSGDAEEIVFSASGDVILMKNTIVQQFVWKFSSVPECLVRLLKLHQINHNCEKSYSAVLKEKFASAMSQLFIDSMAELCKLIALSVTQLPYEKYCSLQYLECSGFCWLEEDSLSSIAVPYAILEYLTHGWCRNVTRIFPPENFLIAFQETSTAVVEAFGDLQSVRSEILFSDSTAFRMNCLGFFDQHSLFQLFLEAPISHRLLLFFMSC
jgi:hypothetical protein